MTPEEIIPAPGNVRPLELKPLIGQRVTAADADAVLADCCVDAMRRHDLIAVCVTGAWHYAVIIREKSEGGSDYWRTFGINGVHACPWCGVRLDEQTPTRRYHRGWQPLDAQVDAILGTMRGPKRPQGGAQA